MFFVMILTAWCALHAYVGWRAASVPAVSRRLPRKWLLAGVAVLALSLPLGRVLGSVVGEGLAAPVELLSMHWLGTLFLISSCLLIVDVVTGFGWWLRRWLSELRAAALVVGALLAAIATVQGVRPPVVRDHEVTLANLPAALDGTVLVAISDLHVGALLGPDWLATRVDQVLAQKPDLVVALGDLVEGHGMSDDGAVVAQLQRLTAATDVWAVVGNHERHGGESGGARLLERAGFQLLRNQWQQVRPGLVLAGIEDTDRHRDGNAAAARADVRDRIDSALAGRSIDAATIFLEHRPGQLAQLAAANVGLTLAGHTHGGQLWPFGYLVGLTVPVLGGRVDVDNMPLIVCRGTGTWGPRMRLWRPGELLRITLRAGPVKT